MGASRAILASLVLAAATLAACTEESYAVVVRFDPPGLVEEVEQLEIAVVPDGCGAVVLGEPAAAPARISLYRRGQELAPLGTADPGTRGLYVRGLSGCSAVAAGCADVSLEAGGPGTLTVTAVRTVGSGCPPATHCDNRVCIPNDAGGVDAGPAPDAGPDASPTDATVAVDGACGECAPGETSSCAASCGEEGVRTCGPTCEWGACEIAPSSDTVALFTFDDEPDTLTVSDVAGGHDGVMAGGSATWSAGPAGCGLALETPGGGPYGEVQDSSDWDLTEGAVDLWVRFDSDGTRTGVLARDASGTTLPGHLSIWRRATGEIVARLQSAAGAAERCTASPVRTGRWIELSVRFGGGADFELVVDGVPVPSDATCMGTSTAGIDGNDNPWVFSAMAWYSDEGAATPIDAPLDGALDHVRIRNGRAPASSPRARGLVLVDTTDDSTLGVLSDGQVLDLSSMPELGMRVTVEPGRVGSVVYALDGDATYNIENIPPYGISGDDAGNYDPWVPPAPGTHTLEVTPFTGPDGTGTAGESFTVTFTVR